MNKYIHKETCLGPIVVKGNGLTVDCVVTVTRMAPRGPMVDHDIEYNMYNMTADHVGGMQPLIDAAYAKGKALAEAYIAARESQAVDATPMPPKNFSKRTTIFSCGRPVGLNGDRREFEVYVQDFCDPSIRWLTLAIGVGSPDEKHIVIPASDLKGFLQAMVDLQATPFTDRFDDEEAA